MVRTQGLLFWFDKSFGMRIGILIPCIFLTSSCLAQYFQYSQYNFTPQRINPAQVGSTDYASASFLYRNQATDGGFHLTSNMLNVEYPLLSRAGVRWSGIGISLMDDRSGQAGIFNTQEVSLTYAVTVHIARYQSLSLGIKGLYQSRKIDLDGLYTGSQYIPDRGFDESISSGENLGLMKNNFMTFSAGLFWHRTDKAGNNIAYWGFSFFDFNKPEDSFLGTSDKLNSTLVASMGFRVYHKGNMSIYPEVLYTHGAMSNVINAGAILRADLKGNPRQEPSHVDLITKYVFGRSGILGFQYHNERFSIGLSYDFPVITRNVANTGAFELGIAIRKLVSRGKRERKKEESKNVSPGQPVAGRKLGATVGVRRPTSPNPAKDSLSRGQTTGKGEMSARLKQKQDSVATLANAGSVTHEPLVLEKATLHFNFEFNSVNLDDHASEYLDDLAKALQDNPELNIKLVGHTDNVGSEKFNLRLSIHRAQTLKDFLVARGVEGARITVEGKGLTEPLNSNQTEDERAQNRRVELTILYAH